MSRFLTLASLLAVVPILGAGSVCAGDVAGNVLMPDVCSPEVSPAVVLLEPVGAKAKRGENPASVPADVALVNQRGLQFIPRVQTLRLGQTIRFTNDDAETHNVHILSPGNEFNEAMAAGQAREFTPVKPGVVRLTCDIHAHMRGFILVSASPWVAVCPANGAFRFRDVPAGRYKLTAWHEMGQPLKQEITVEAGKDLDLPTLTLSGPIVTAPRIGRVAPVRAWAEVIDRIGILMASSIRSAGRPDGFKLAAEAGPGCLFRRI